MADQLCGRLQSGKGGRNSLSWLMFRRAAMITKLGGKRASPIGIGTYGMGGAVVTSRGNDRKDVDALNFALDNGINVIDTAEMYGHGHAEELVAKAIRGREREDLFIITKVLPTHLKKEAMARAVRGSLARMGTDYIDLYLIHWLLPTSNIGEAVSNMEGLVEEGLVRNIGVSNFDAGETGKAIRVAKPHRIIANQIRYNLFKKRCEEELIPFCEKNGVRIIAYTPLSKGSLGHGRIEDIRKVKEVSERTGKTPVQVALNYLMKRSLPIPKSSSREHIREILGAMGWQLSKDDYEYLSRI